jgi:PadR family transcriptional regulator PadR
MQDEFDETIEKEENSEDKQSVSSDLIRGHINTIILRALYEGDRYGYEIISEIERKSHGQYSLKQPSLYSALKRLEKEGYITSYWGGSVSGGRRKYFSLTDAGKLISEQNQSEWEYSRTVIDSLISDKDFDFSNPAPVPVDMRVLRDSTTRARTSSGENNTEDTEQREQILKEFERERESLQKRKAELEEEAVRLNRERSRMEELSQARELFEEERATFTESAGDLEEARAAFEEETARFEAEKAKYEAEMEARNDALLREREWREYEIAERERRLEEEKKSLAENQTRISDEEYCALNERLLEQEHELNRQRAIYEQQIRGYEQELVAVNERHAEEMARRERQIIEEQEALFHQREQQLLHQNYVDLINAPPTDNAVNEYPYFTAPVGDEPQTEQPLAPIDENDDGYRSVVRKIYANSINPEPSETPHRSARTERATSLDGIDFHDLEARAAEENIRIVTAGGKSKTQIGETSSSVTHKGKALFISAIVLFLFCIALGSILLALRGTVTLPVYYPYLIWGIALIVLLICGLAFANKFGEGALRRTSYAVINAAVLFILLVIISLIVALWVRIDFADISAVTTYLVVPIVFSFGILLFGIIYYCLVKPKNN